MGKLPPFAHWETKREEKGRKKKSLTYLHIHKRGSAGTSLEQPYTYEVSGRRRRLHSESSLPQEPIIHAETPILYLHEPHPPTPRRKTPLSISAKTDNLLLVLRSLTCEEPSLAKQRRVDPKYQACSQYGSPYAVYQRFG